MRVVLSVVVTGATSAPSPQGSQASTLELVRSLSGTRGEIVDGAFEMADPRSVFTLPYDRQVVVFFEWDAAPGQYRIEGRWRDPSGAVVLSAPIDIDSGRSRFGMHWSLALPERLVSGQWTLEAHFGEQQIGSHSFEIRGGVPLRLSPDRVYECALEGVALIEARGGRGELLSRGAGTALDADHIVTSLAAIEAAEVVRALPASGGALETREVAAWDRRGDWAILRLESHGLTPIPHEGADSLVVGSSVYVLDTLDDASHVIGEGGVVGRSASAQRPGTPLLNEDFATGSPVMDARCRLVGVIMGDREASLGSIGIQTGVSSAPRLDRGRSVLPVGSLPLGESPTTLAELAENGVFIPPLAPEQRHVVSGVFCSRVLRNDIVTPADQKTVFSRLEGTATAFVTWSADAELDAQGHFALYDADNRELVTAEPGRLRLRPNTYQASVFTIQLGSLRPGVHRVDAFVDGAPVWRGYFEVTE